MKHIATQHTMSAASVKFACQHLHACTMHRCHFPLLVFGCAAFKLLVHKPMKDPSKRHPGIGAQSSFSLSLAEPRLLKFNPEDPWDTRPGLAWYAKSENLETRLLSSTIGPRKYKKWKMYVGVGYDPFLTLAEAFKFCQRRSVI